MGIYAACKLHQIRPFSPLDIEVKNVYSNGEHKGMFVFWQNETEKLIYIIINRVCISSINQKDLSMLGPFERELWLFKC